ncbi:hypothetical protein J4711_14945 [Staphylococcus epidermidis]|nr:hypothetical protein [Staphylococcus epidermidis]
MTLQEMLDSLDAVIQTVSASLQTRISALEQSSTRLRDAMVAVAQLVKRFAPEDWTPELRERAQKLMLTSPSCATSWHVFRYSTSAAHRPWFLRPRTAPMKAACAALSQTGRARIITRPARPAHPIQFS